MPNDDYTTLNSTQMNHLKEYSGISAVRNPHAASLAVSILSAQIEEFEGVERIFALARGEDYSDKPPMNLDVRCGNVSERKDWYSSGMVENVGRNPLSSGDDLFFGEGLFVQVSMFVPAASISDATSVLVREMRDVYDTPERQAAKARIKALEEELGSMREKEEELRILRGSLKE